MNPKQFTWKHKDANLDRWRLEVKRGRKDTDRCDKNDHNDPDYWWGYKMINDNTNRIHFTGEILGQYDYLPTIDEFLLNIQFELNRLCMEMSKYAEI